LLYEPGRFEGVELSARTQRFARQVQGIYADLATYPNQNVHTPIRLARQLLEEAYPKEIAKSLGGVYPELEIRTPSAEDSQRCFTEYLNDAQRRLDHDRRAPNEPKQIKPGEDVRIIDNRVQVSGQVAVMAINALLTRVIFDANPDHEFFVEESFPLEWMYPYLSPFGIIMKINRNILPELTDEMVRKDHDFWSQFSQRLIGNWITYDTSVSNLCTFAERVYYRRNYEAFKGDPAFVRDNDGQKAFSKLRSSIAGVYAWRISNSKSPVEQQRMIKEAEFAFKQSYAFCPYSPEAIFRYINLLIGFGRVDDALQLAATSRKLDPNNGQLENLVFELQRIKQQQQQSAAGHAQSEAPSAPGQSQALVAQLEQQLRAQPGNMTVAIQLITAYIQNQQSDRALALVDQIVGSPSADANMLVFAAQVYQQLNNLPKLEQTLAKMVKLSPDNPEAWFDLAGIQALINMPSQAVVSLDESLTRSAQRLTRDSNAANLYSNAQSDQRFAPLRSVAEFQKVLDKHKPPPK
jgi:thioredoxin-like negative regulator of GroEL